MFRVEIAEDAKRILAQHLADSVYPQAGIYIFQELKTADVSRGEDGPVNWTIDRPKRWCLSICAFGKIAGDDIIYADGFPVYLTVIEPTSALGVAVKAKNGQVFVEPLDA
jgi:hypothetical protein